MHAALQAASPAAAGGSGALPLLSDSAIYSNALWLPESPAGVDPTSTAAPSPLRQPLKTLTAAAVEAAAGGADEPDGAHLIAAPSSRAASLDEQGPFTQLAARKQARRGMCRPRRWEWPLNLPHRAVPSCCPQTCPLLNPTHTSQVARSSAEASLDSGAGGSPRIGAVMLRRHSSGSLGALVRHLSQRLLLGGRAEDAGPAAPEVAPLAQPHHAPDAAASEGSSDVAGILPHVSPAHLLAPAQPSLWAGSPPPVQLQLMAASGDSAHQQGDDLLLDLDLLDDLLPTAQPLAGPHQQLSPQQQDETAVLLQQQLSDLSSPTSGAYSPAVAAGRNLGGPADSGGAAPASSSGTSWQQQREAGQARSLAHPIFDLQPTEPAQPSQHQAVAGLQALLAAQRRQGQEASPASLLVRPAAEPAAAAGAAGPVAAWDAAGAQQPGGLCPAWSMEGGHVELDLDLLEALPQAVRAGSGTASSTLSLALAAIPDAAPLAVGEWDHGSAHPLLDSPQLSLERQQQEQQQEEGQYVLFGPSMAAQYTPMLLRFEQLDIRRIRCGAVADDAWAAASGHLVALPYGNAVLHVCHAVVSASHPSNHRICVCFPQAGSEGKPEAAGGRGGSAAVQAIALPPPHTWLLLSQHWRPAAAPPVGWVQGGQPALMLCALRLELFHSTGALLLDCHWRVPFHLVQEGSGSAADAGAVHGPPALLARRPAAL